MKGCVAESALRRTFPSTEKSLCDHDLPSVSNGRNSMEAKSPQKAWSFAPATGPVAVSGNNSKSLLRSPSRWILKQAAGPEGSVALPFPLASVLLFRLLPTKRPTPDQQEVDMFESLFVLRCSTRRRS
mmetsp:Transcript_75807/g.165352  ORF Transcript_75807/g.165352 Transcript_75807/m.165352 type:complete len:128 (-) Transcript_75807:5-388(-)